MAKHGIKGMIGGGAAAGGAAEKVIHAWQQVQAKHGREMGTGRRPYYRLLLPYC